MSITPAGGWNRPEEDEVQQPLRRYTRAPSGSTVVIYEEKRSRSVFRTAFFACLGVLFALWCVFFGVGFINGFIKGFNGSRAQTIAESQSENLPVVEVSAYAINAAFEANEPAADQLYANRTLRVSGVVTSISKDAWNQTYITMADGAFLGVNATMQDTATTTATAQELFKGQHVTVMCTKVRYVMEIVQLSNCDFLKTSPLPSAPFVYQGNSSPDP